MTINKPLHPILYLDDERDNLIVFNSAFRRDYEVHLAGSGQEGIEILRKHEIKVIITDQRMPEMTGVELLKQIKDQFPDIPPNRLMVSGYAAPEDIEEAFNHYHLYKFIHKPWEADELKKTILHAILNDHE